MELQQQLEDALKSAVEDTFTVTLSLSPKINTDMSLPLQENTIISSIGLAGAIEGNISLWITVEAAAKVVFRMLGMEVDIDSPDIMDGVGEIVNMIAGGVKMKMDSTEYKFDISIPSTVKGDNIESVKSDKTSEFTQLYCCDEEDIRFQVKFAYRLHQSAGEKEVQSEKETAISAFDKLSQLVEGSKKEDNDA